MECGIKWLKIIGGIVAALIFLQITTLIMNRAQEPYQPTENTHEGVEPKHWD